MTFDVPAARSVYSSLSDGWAYLDAGQRIQVPKRVQAAMISAFCSAQKSLPGGTGAGAHGQLCNSGISATAELAANACRAFANLASGPVAGVVLGSSREALMGQFTSTMSRRLTFGSNLVISRIGSQVVHAPLRRTANLYGAQVWIAEANLPSGMLPSRQFDEFVGEHTRFAVIPAVDPFTGTIAPVADISRRVYGYSNVWVLVGALDTIAYLDILMSKLDADVMLVSASVLGRPEVAVLVFRGPGVFERMMSLSYVPNARGIEWIEVSPVSPAPLGGVSESVLHLISLDSTTRGSRRHRIETAMPQVSRYLTTLSERLIAALIILPWVYIVGMDTEDDPLASVSRAQHIPCVSFLVDRVSVKVVVDRLLDNGFMTSIIDTYESLLLKTMGIDEAGDATRVGLQSFSTPHDIDQLVRAVASLG